MPADVSWGVDLGGTKLAIGNGAAHHEEPTGASAQDIVEQIVRGTPAGARIGLCVAGRVDTRSGTTLAAQLPQLTDFPLVAALQARDRTSFLMNDADAGALAEFHLGAGRGARTLLYVTVGTGIGGGLVHAGQLYQGAGGQALEVGHAGGGEPGLPCPCGRTGCIDTVASGRAIHHDARAAAQRPEWPDSDIARAARAGDPTVRAIIEVAARRTAQAVAGFCVLFNPDVLVLGGGIVEAHDDLYVEPFQQGLAAHMGGWSRPEVRRAGCDRRAGVLGAMLHARTHANTL